MKRFAVFFLLIFSLMLAAQVTRIDSVHARKAPKDTAVVAPPKSEEEVITDLEKANAPQKPVRYNPTKAGLYSAVLPGLGQYYNKKYWKIPIVWGAIGTGIGITIWNENQYSRYRSAFIAELNGQTHEFSTIPGITADALGRAQDRSKRQRDYAIAITSLIYILNIVDAVVDAHLYEGRKDPDLALKPTVIFDEFSHQNTKAGLSFNYNF